MITDNGNLGLPRSGSWFAVLNSTGHASNGTISKSIKIPNSATAMLRFYMLLSVDSSGAGSSGTVDVKINDQPSPNNAGHLTTPTQTTPTSGGTSP